MASDQRSGFKPVDQAASAAQARRVRVEREPSFEVERKRYDFRFCCEDCGHFDALREVCRHDWPNQAHRRAATDSLRDPGRGPVQAQDLAPLIFCKEFEL